jgi:hypothetical protein
MASTVSASFPPERKRSRASHGVVTATIEQIRETGAAIMKRESYVKYNIGSKQVFNSRWTQFFGVEDVVCMKAWNMMRINPFDDEEVRQAEIKHMLWGLMWLKGYDTESRMLNHAGCKDEGTFRKWSKIFVQRLSWLIHDVVSVHCTHLLN